MYRSKMGKWEYMVEVHGMEATEANRARGEVFFEVRSIALWGDGRRRPNVHFNGASTRLRRALRSEDHGASMLLRRRLVLGIA